MRANAAAIGVIAALVLGVGVGSGAQGPRTTSWADANHGWRVWPEPSSACCFVQSTENGGRSWHTIFPRHGNGGLGILRLSRLSGLVSVFFQRTYPDTYWTRDNGRHWYRTSPRLLRIPYVGRGRLLYTWNAGVVTQISPWPPTRSVRCRHWVVKSGAHICRGEAHDGGMRGLPAARAPAGQEFNDFRLLAGGFLALSQPRTPWTAEPWTPSVSLRRDGDGRVASLPAPELAPDLHLFYTELLPPRWPRLAVRGLAGQNWGCPQPGTPCADIRWASTDGGLSWSVSTTRQA